MSFGRIAVTMVATGAALTLGLMAPRQALAQSTPAYSVNAYVSTDAAGNPNSTPTPFEPVGATEYFDGEGILQMAFEVGGPPENDDLGCCSTFNHAVPTVPSVTSVTLGISSLNSFDSVSANASAYANLATGTLGVSGNSQDNHRRSMVSLRRGHQQQRRFRWRSADGGKSALWQCGNVDRMEL